jgi:hypothetical protein
MKGQLGLQTISTSNLAHFRPSYEPLHSASPTIPFQFACACIPHTIQERRLYSIDPSYLLFRLIKVNTKGDQIRRMVIWDTQIKGNKRERGFADVGESELVVRNSDRRPAQQYSSAQSISDCLPPLLTHLAMMVCSKSQSYERDTQLVVKYVTHLRLTSFADICLHRMIARRAYLPPIPPDLLESGLRGRQTLCCSLRMSAC